MPRSAVSKWSWTGYKKSRVCCGRRTTGVDRGWTFGIEHCTTVSVGGTVAVRLVLSTARRERTESGTDAGLGRTIHADTFLWCAENDEGAPRARLPHQSEKSPATTAADGTGSDLSETTAVGADAWSSDLSLPAASCRDHAAQSSVVQRYNLHPATRRLHLSGSGHRLVQPVRAQLGNIDEPGCRILLFGVGLGVAARSSRNLQHGPGISIHKRSLHQPPRSQQHPDQHGWSRPRIGQRFRRAAVEDSQIRRCLSERLHRSSRCRSESWAVLPVLQCSASASGVELSNTRSRVSRRESLTKGHAQGRPSCRSSFIGHPEATFFPPNAKNKDGASRQHLLTSFKRHEEIYPNDEGADHKADALAHLSD